MSVKDIVHIYRLFLDAGQLDPAVAPALARRDRIRSRLENLDVTQTESGAVEVRRHSQRDLHTHLLAIADSSEPEPEEEYRRANWRMARRIAKAVCRRA